MTSHLKSIMEDTQAVIEVVGIILMITIATVTAAAVYVSMGQINDSNPILAVYMVQDKEYIIIIKVRNNAIGKNDTIINVINSSGSSAGLTGTLHSAGNNVAGGDTITISGVVSGETYSVQMIYMDNVVGSTKYIAP